MDVCEDLLNACYSQNLVAVESILHEGISPNIQDSEGVSPLQIAAANGNLDLTNLLVENGAIIDLPNNYGWTPLMHAARYGHAAILSMLLRKKAKVNICNKLGLRPLAAAVWSGQLSVVKSLVEAGAIVDHMPSVMMQNAECDLSSLMAAALLGYDAIFRFLLEKGAAVNQASPVTGLTPLMLAACNGHKHIVQIIIEWGGDANKMSICGQTALDISVSRSKREVKAYLENMTFAKSEYKNSIDTDFLQCVRNGDISKIKSMLLQNINVINIQDQYDGCTPLMVASKLGYNNIAALLLSNGAKLDLQDSAHGWTALMYAVFHRHDDTVKLLVTKGANRELCALNGYTALDLARHIDSSETKIVDYLGHTGELSSKEMNKLTLPTTPKKRKFSFSDKSVSKGNQQQTRLMGWIGGVAQQLQQKVFLRQSSKIAEATCRSNPDIQVSDATNDNVFNDPEFPTNAPCEAKLNISDLLSPNKHLSTALRKQSFEAVSPPLLSSLNSDVDFIKKYSRRALVHDENQKKPFVSLRTPRLLKDYTKRKKEGQKI